MRTEQNPTGDTPPTASAPPAPLTVPPPTVPPTAPVQLFDLSVKDGRKNLILMAGITLVEVSSALAKAEAKIKNAGKPIVHFELAETEETA